MRLFSLTGASIVADPVHGHFTPDEDGGFSLPGPLHEKLHGSAVKGRKQWEDELERQQRTGTEELARQRSPEALFSLVSKLVQAAETAAPAPEAAKAAAKAAPAAKAADGK